MKSLPISRSVGLWAVAALLPSGSPVSAQVLRGTVVDSTSGRVVAGATVTVLDTAGREVDLVVTGADGRFSFHLSVPGDYRARVRRIGYAGALTKPIAIRVGVESIVRLAILPTGVPLDTLTVRAESVAVEQRIPWLADVGFYDRRGKGFGYFLTRTDIERDSPLIMSDVLHEIPGVRVLCTRPLACSIIMPGALTMFMRGKCEPSIVLDGIVLRVGGTGGAASVDSLLNPFNVEAVEVYPSAAGVPVQWGGYISPCGAIVVWSRR